MENVFNTSDMASIAVLITVGYKVISLKKTQPGKTVFSFADDGQIQKILNRYWAKDLNVSARDFFENIKMIKTRMSQTNLTNDHE